ncbi:MAG: hypothetical protein QXR45_16570 [Candidatus Bathyarchaeia archaeon]
MRTRTKILLSMLIVILVVIVIGAAFITGLITIPRSTKLVVNPSTFIVESGGSIILSARLESDTFILSGKTITWSASDGTFDKNIGEMVTYKAPTVTENKTITITVSFPGDREYYGTSTIITGIVIPKKKVSTTLTISPSMFELPPGGKITLTAILSPTGAPSDIISWSLEGPGRITPTTGTTITYEAPSEVKEKMTVKIVATFPGTDEYSPSVYTCIGEIVPIAKIPTVLTVSPENFKINVGERIVLTATLKDNVDNILTDKILTWKLEGPGRLSSTTGTSIEYIAPEEVSEEVEVKIIISFAGDEKYGMSSTIVIGKVVPTAIVVEEEYAMTFDRAQVKNLRIEGPLTLAGRSVVRITADVIDFVNFNVTRVGMSAESVGITSVEIYATILKAYSPELGKTIEVTGEEKVSLGPYDTISLEKATIRFIQASAKSGYLVKVKVIGEYVGGSEPYIPVLVHSPNVELSEGYALLGPYSYSVLKNAVLSFKVGKGVITNLALIHPVQYSLDRESNKVYFVSKWAATASKASLENAFSYCIYLTFNAYGVMKMTFTGEDNPEMFHGANVGYGGTVTDASIHVVYAEISKLSVEDFTLKIVS